MISSFSYRHGFPDDMSGNGGGFVFDCRALPNPGREERYRAFNGKDQVIIDYLKDEPAVINFLGETEKLVSSSVENYLQRGFSSLSVSFGCTGGQHRSVYCAETLAGRLRERFGEAIIMVNHLMFKL
jgi:RNase adaptor protein for sRNA GlmZ degradation